MLPWIVLILVLLVGCQQAPVRREPPRPMVVEPFPRSPLPDSALSGVPSPSPRDLPPASAPRDSLPDAKGLAAASPPSSAVSRPASPSLPSKDPEKPRPSSATETLLSQAEAQLARNDGAGAIMTLERALRLEPRNPELWYRLGEVQLRQGNASQAEQAARRAESLAGNNRSLRAQSWRLIASARTLQGNLRGAEEAEDRARSF